MEKFCGKCGARLDEQTGKCPNCDKAEIKPAVTQAKPQKTAVKRSKTVPIIIIAAAVVILAVGTVCVLAYNDTVDIPFVKNILVSMGIKHDDASDASSNNDNDSGNTTSVGGSSSNTGEVDVDLSSNYEVPTFDADKYFRENTTLVSSTDVAVSDSNVTEYEVYNLLSERGFTGVSVTYEYNMDGTYCGSREISIYSSAQHPIYQAYYVAQSGDAWMILVVNGSVFASPISYNFSDGTKAQVIISETDTITSYDSTANKYYVNIPNKSETVIKTVAEINAETLEKLNIEEIDKL